MSKPSSESDTFPDWPDAGPVVSRPLTAEQKAWLAAAIRRGDPSVLARNFPEREFYEAIGAFVFKFSQLEFLIRSQLIVTLKLALEDSYAIVGPYDFAMLCTVTRTILSKRSPAHAKQLKILFGKCYKLNSERVKIVHGRWSGFGAIHVPRNSLEPTSYFPNPDDVKRLADEARSLQHEIIDVWSSIQTEATAAGDTI